MDEREARSRFAAAPVARMATVRPDGSPHIVPVVFALEGDRVYSLVDAKPKRSRALRRLENIRANPTVSLLVDHYEGRWESLWWVRADGDATVVEEGSGRDRAVELLTAKYAQYQEWRTEFGGAVVVEVGRWSYWSFT